MENQIFELQYAIDTFYFLVCGALVMWMAAGFSMLEAGMVRSKNTAEILTKNVALFAISCVMYMIYGYSLMYGGEVFLSGIAGGETLVTDALTASAENGFGGDSVYSSASDFFFQVVFVATAMSIVSGAVAERMKLWAFLIFAVVMTGFTGTNTDCLFKTGDENLAVADLACVCSLGNRFNDLVDHLRSHGRLEFHLGQKINHIFRTAIKFRVALLASEAFYLGNGNALHTDLRQAFTNIIELERLDDCCY